MATLALTTSSESDLKLASHAAARASSTSRDRFSMARMGRALSPGRAPAPRGMVAAPSSPSSYRRPESPRLSPSPATATLDKARHAR
ncbi:unnamed protein product [Cutaneotrichosporon oleaginosum]